MNKYWIRSKLYQAVNKKKYTKFERIRTLLIKNDTIECSCKTYERSGRPCTHMMIFLSMLLPEMFPLRFLRTFYHYYGSDTDITHIYKQLQERNQSQMSHFNMIDTDRLLLTKHIFKDTEYPKISINERVGILDDFF